MASGILKVRNLRNKSEKKCAMFYLELKDTVKGSVSMKHGILKRVIALCITGGVMALALAACGDSENKDEGEGTVQDATQEDEDGTVGVTENEETVIADSSGNDVRVAHVSSSGSSGNGFAIPVFKPGEEPDPGEELQPGEEPKPGADPKPGTGTPIPQSNAGTQQPQSSAGAQQPQQPQPNSGTQTAHTHNFQGGNCSTPAVCSCGATGSYGGHNWVTQKIHHDAKGHYENKVVGTEQVSLGQQEVIIYKCGGGGGMVKDDNGNLMPAGCGFSTRNKSEMDSHKESTGHKGTVSSTIYEEVYETRDITENVWVVDSAAWDENITTCSTCGAKQ